MRLDDIESRFLGKVSANEYYGYIFKLKEKEEELEE